jgi:LmbE family N-acetylglucosaminyl deacetylase
MGQLEDTDVLIVVAHPDDDAMFASSVYRLTHELGGRADLLLVTDGAGGYRFSTLAEPIYGLKLTDPEVARRYLPAIRKQELMAGGAIVGISNYFFLDQPDRGKILDADSILTHLWDRGLVARQIDRVLAETDYDFLYVHLPREIMHAHHKAATILALEAVQKIPSERRPVVLVRSRRLRPKSRVLPSIEQPRLESTTGSITRSSRTGW